MLVGSLGFIVVLGGRNPTSWLFGGMFAISTLGMMATGAGRGGAARTSTIDEDRRDYLRYLDQMRRTVRGDGRGAARVRWRPCTRIPRRGPRSSRADGSWERSAGGRRLRAACASVAAPSGWPPG